MPEPDPLEVESYKAFWTTRKDDLLIVVDEDSHGPRIIETSGEDPRMATGDDYDLVIAVMRRMYEAGVPVVTWDEMLEAHHRRRAARPDEGLPPAPRSSMGERFRTWLARREMSFASRVRLLEPWVLLGEDATDFEDRYHQEVGPGHILHGVPVIAVARHLNFDLVLFELKGIMYELGELYLSGAGQRDEHGEWRIPNMFLDDDDWIQNSMLIDHENPGARRMWD